MILQKRGISVTGMKISIYKKHLNGLNRKFKGAKTITVKTISNKIAPASVMTFSHMNTRQVHPAYQAVLLGGKAKLPYQQPLRHHKFCVLRKALFEIFKILFKIQCLLQLLLCSRNRKMYSLVLR
jgi:hypothetical protein